MFTPARIIRAVGATLAIIGIALVAFTLVARGRDDAPPAGEAAATPAEGAPEAAPVPVVPPTPIPTATPAPTPTAVPTPLPFTDAAPLGLLTEDLATPLPDCGLLTDTSVVAGTVTLRCIEEWASVPVVAAAEGRVVHVSNSPAIQGVADGLSSPVWSWAEQAELGPHVVVDHGALGGTTNTQTVYAGLSSIEEGIKVGTPVTQGQPLGLITGPEAKLQFAVWADNVRQDGVTVLADGPDAETQRSVAAALGPILASPTDELCPLVRSAGQLPGAPRQYRNGTHRGIDFGCGAADRSGYAIADGTVVYVVNDYDDPTVAEREDLLRRAGIAGFTPHWTLVMLYGNVVVVDHGEIPGAGRVVTITAHLEEVDPSIQIGSPVTAGQRLGELGNRGTNASAQGVRGAADPSLHLHWELFIDNWYLGSGLDAGTISELITTALCGQAQTPGCPA